MADFDETLRLKRIVPRHTCVHLSYRQLTIHAYMHKTVAMDMHMRVFL